MSFIIVVLFSCITAFYISYNITDGDAASELVLGKLLATQNRIITTDWFYSSEIRFFNTNLVYMPLFKIFDDWHLVRFISVLIFQAMLVASYYYLSRRMKMSTNAFFLSASLLLLPMTDIYGRFVLYHNYYSPCFIFGFLIVGLYLSLLEPKEHKYFRQALRLIALLALAFISCLNGFRQLPSTLLPLFLTALFIQMKNRRTPERSAARTGKPVWLAGLVLAAGIAGLYVYTLILPRYCSSESVIHSTVKLLSAANLRRLLLDYLNLFGYQESTAPFSLGGLITLCGAVGAAIMLFLPLVVLFSREKLTATRLVALLYPISMIQMTVLFLLVSGYENYVRYYLQTFIWIIPFLGILLDRQGVSPHMITGKQVLALLVSLFFIISGTYFHLYYHGFYHQIPDVTSGVNTDIYSVDRLQPAVDFLEEDGYDVGYATHWNANIITEMTNGRIPMISIIRVFPEYFYLYRDWLTNKQYRERSFVEDQNIFLLLTREEADVFSGSELAALSIPVYEDAHYIVFTFDFSTEVWDYLLEQAKRINQTSVLDQLYRR